MKVFEQLVAFSDSKEGKPRAAISQEDYDLWRRDFIWESLHGQRYGQSFCNRFGITDFHLFYSSGDIEWSDNYIKKNYIERA